jgi:hypothetical protein
MTQTNHFCPGDLPGQNTHAFQADKQMASRFSRDFIVTYNLTLLIGLYQELEPVLVILRFLWPFYDK